MKVAILGTENSHAYAFAQLIRENPKYADLEVVGLYSYEAAPSEKIVADGYASYIATYPDEFVGKVDAVIITARDGNLHYKYAMPYLKAGVSMFVDKPFAIQAENAREMIAVAKQTGAKICGGSSLKFLDELQPLKRFAAAHKLVGGSITAPVSMVNDYGGFYFYAQHLIEMLFTVFGTGIRSVFAECKDITKNRVNLLFDYGDFDVTAQYYDCYNYTAAVYSKDGCKQTVIEDVVYCYERELDELHTMLKTGVMPNSYERLLQPVLLLQAIEQSYLYGKKVELAW